ncbi:replication factor C large subunit [Archaeoglobus veneficus]|uniref:Replication factor C large subunit n=1 Tax=Archaeoglobus veneficus (strain DSM 11195 / SNP6) TaxID=693661 RepID=F2KQS9_ARCVS|nr:replication factor C large subunit [Archaeoglobus veneficus]AEA46641.1 Replication factor C large subunit [Archaeoglobus veneficus SNP6]
MLWVEKYRPKTIKDVVADKKVLEKVVTWAKNWEKGIVQKPLLFAGPPGTGKTSLALAIANTFGWEVVELNASDQRNWRIIYHIVGEGAFSETISDEGEFLSIRQGRLKLIILDEVDNIHKKEDAGGEGALIRLLKKKPRQPIILTANEPYNLSAELRNLCEMITFRRLDVRRVVAVLERICAQEGIRADRRALESIARNAGGDLRAAINDLQAIAEGKTEIRVEDVVTAKRTQETDVFKVMQKIFKTTSSAVYSEAMLLDESPDDFINWIDENLPLEYSGEDLLKGYLVLSRADIFLGRVRRRQFYRLWKYATYLMTAGVQQVKKEARRGFTRYRRPAIWQMLAASRQRREKMKTILAKIGRYSHLSKKKASTEMYFTIKFLLSKTEIPIAASVAAFYDFSEDDIKFITGDEERAKEIMKYVKEHRLHRVEDESFLTAFEMLEREEELATAAEAEEEKLIEVVSEEGDESEEETEEKVKRERREKRRKKKSKGKEVTLDFFS